MEFPGEVRELRGQDVEVPATQMLALPRMMAELGVERNFEVGTNF